MFGAHEMLFRNRNEIGRLVAQILPATLGVFAYIAGLFRIVQQFLTKSSLFDMLRHLPAINQLYMLEQSRQGQEAADRYAAICVCQFLALFASVAIMSVYSILKDQFEMYRNIRNLDIRFRTFLLGLMGSTVSFGTFFLSFPTEDLNRKAILFEYTDLKFFVFYFAGYISIISIAALIRITYQLLRDLKKRLTL